MMEVEIYSGGLVRIPNDTELCSLDRALLEAAAQKSRADSDVENTNRFLVIVNHLQDGCFRMYWT